METNQKGNDQNGHTPGPEFGATGLQPQDQPTDQTLTTRQGHPLTNNQNVRTVGSRGPTTLENYPFLEKISHFDRKRNDLINNLVDALSGAQKDVQNKMIELFGQCDEDYGRRLKEGLQQAASGNGQQPHGQANEQAGHEAVQQAEELSHEAKPY